MKVKRNVGLVEFIIRYTYKNRKHNMQYVYNHITIYSNGYYGKYKFLRYTYYTNTLTHTHIKYYENCVLFIENYKLV